MRDVVIIGGGASGLVAAICAARRGKKVTILERNDKCGKKLLITGNGRCNFWNADQDLEHYHSNNSDLISGLINDVNMDKVLDFFNSLGIVSKVKNGYYYPFSGMAVTIQNALVEEALRLGVEIKYNFMVEKVVSGEYFEINYNGENIRALKVILAGGSKAASKTGSDGSSYDIAWSLGHTVIRPLPALVSLKGEGDYFKKWSGIRTEVILSLYEDDNFVKSEAGEIQLVDYGISGIVSFNLSRYIAKGLDAHKEKILINFLPFMDNVSEFLNKQSKLGYSISETLERVLNYKLVNVLIKRAKLHSNNFNDLSREEFSRLVSVLSEFELNIVDTGSFEKAQVCSGGIPLSEIDLGTMESLKVPGLYLTGEVIDIDGDCGGYNLGVAWMSGIVAGESV